MKAPTHVKNDTLFDRTREVWKPRLGCDVSRDDARQIAENITGFFAILAEWSRADKRAPANDIDKSAISHVGEVRNES